MTNSLRQKERKREKAIPDGNIMRERKYIIMKAIENLRKKVIWEEEEEKSFFISCTIYKYIHSDSWLSKSFLFGYDFLWRQLLLVNKD